MISWIIKKAFVYIISIFLVLNLVIYLSFYMTFVLNSPEDYKRARFNLINAHFISFYEVYPIMLNVLDYQSSLLMPIRKFKMYFYEKGISQLPNDEVERAVWYGLIEFIPLYKDLINKNSLRLYNFYDKQDVEYFIEQIYKNFIIITSDKFVDSSNRRIKERVFPLLHKYYQLLTYNFYLPRKNYSLYDIQVETIKNTNKVNNLKEVFLRRLDFFSKPMYQEDIKKDLDALKINLMLMDILTSSVILENIIMHEGYIPNNEEYNLIYKQYTNLIKEQDKYIEDANKNLSQIMLKNKHNHQKLYKNLNKEHK